LTPLVNPRGAYCSGTLGAIEFLVAGKEAMIKTTGALSKRRSTMRTSMKFIIVTGEVLLLGLLAAAGARGAEFPPIKPTYLMAQQASSVSPYTPAKPVRVTMVNKDGQVSTLEYREPQRFVNDGPLVPINSLPARELDLPTTQDIRPIGYQYQSNYPSTTTATVPIRNVAHCNQPAVVNYAPAAVAYPPATQYSMPNYAVPVTGVPQTVYRPVAPVAVAPVVQNNLQIGAGLYGQPVIYRPGQPVRNAWRWLTP
jgi:hypothetical protein